MNVDTLVAVNWWAIIPLVVVGSLLHFVYDWSGHHRVVAVFGAVNESYWEHTKIAIWPVATLQVALFALGGWRMPSFVPAATLALYAIPISMIGLVYLYKAMTRRNILALDITVFAVAIMLAQVVFVLVLTELAASPATIAVAALFLAGLVASALVFTVRPPAEPDLFLDPITGRYGRDGHSPDSPLAAESGI